jgi:hypothetical protein
LRDINKFKSKEDIWTIDNDSILNVKYDIYKENQEYGNINTNIDKILFLNTVVSSLETINEKESIKDRKEKPKIAKKITFDIPNTFNGRNVKKMKTTKSLVKLDSLRKTILGIKEKEEENKIECNILVTEPTAETLNNTVLQLNRLDYERIQLDDNEVFVGETFADMFFIAGLPFKGSKVITESEKILGPCKHKDCAILQSYRADLLHRFPNIDYKGFELNSHVNLI